MMYNGNRSMRFSKGIALTAVSAVLLLSGCWDRGGRKGPAESSDRLEYAPQVNEVDTIILRR